MIIFGTKGREEPRGVVADFCPHCQVVRAFRVIDIFEVAHVYFVGVGKGTPRGTLIRCLNCEQQYEFQSSRYRTVMSPEEARYCSLEELLQRTNPDLLRPVPRMVRCNGCGYEREQPFRFCPHCGTPSGL